MADSGKLLTGIDSFYLTETEWMEGAERRQGRRIGGGDRGNCSQDIT